ncbi:MAG: DinB family protein [Acidobacteria bacterium]|nr:DinB family protein [Acidobacteriota bacterium]
MTPEFCAGLRDFLLNALDGEVAATKKVILAIPENQLEYVPDPKATPALKLAHHIVASEIWFFDSVAGGAFGEFPGGDAPPTPAAVVEWWESVRPAARAKVAAMSGDDLAKVLDFYGMFQFPGAVYLNFANVHCIHHRGQLSSYLRPMGSKVPSIYGGSADEPMTM